MWKTEQKSPSPKVQAGNQRTGFWQRIGDYMTLKKGEILAYPGEIPLYCYYIKTGRVIAYTVSELGMEQVFFVFEPGSTILEQYLLAGRKCRLYYKASEKTTVRKISGKQLTTAMKGNESLTMDVIESVTNFGDIALERMLLEKQGNAAVKICDVFIDMAANFGEEECDGRMVITQKISQDMISKLAGVHRVTVVREMKKMKELGILKQEDGLYILPDLAVIQRYRNEQ